MGLLKIVQQDKRGLFLTYLFAFFSFFYHLTFLFTFKFLNMPVMYYFNFVSVTIFLILCIVLPLKKNYVFVYQCGLTEVAVHQMLAIYFVGVDSHFQYLLLAAALTFLLTCNGHYIRPIIYSIFSAIVFIGVEICSKYLPGVYEITDQAFFVIKAVNTGCGIFLILFGVFIFTFIVNNIEENLKIQVKEKTEDLENRNNMVSELQNHMIFSLASLVENRDSDTGAHIKRTSKYIGLLAKRAADKGLYTFLLTDSYIELLQKAAPLHDIGKIVVPDSILKKPGKLTDEEFDIMKQHTVRGSQIVQEVVGVSEDKRYVKTACDIALYHHEKWNGNGYPRGLKGKQIPVCARIMALADVFDALVTKRCYKEAMSMDLAFQIIKNEAGNQFDPQLAEIFVELKPQLEEIALTYQDAK